MFSDLFLAVNVLQALAAAAAVTLSVIVVRRRYFSQLSDVPGPFVASFSVSLWHLWHIWKGHVEIAIVEQHRKHGTFVRIGHNEVSICDPSVVRTILMSHMNKGLMYSIFGLSDKRYLSQMAELDCKEHIRKAKNLAAGYSLTSVIKTEPFIDSALLLLESQLDKLSSMKQPVRFEEWFNYLAFDVIGEATFSQNFGFLEAGEDIGNTVANNVYLRIYISILGHFPWAHKYLLGNPLLKYFNMAPAIHTLDTCMAAVQARSKSTEVRRDMFAHWREQLAKHPDRMQEGEIVASMIGNLGAGSDTVSTVLQAFVYHMIRDPEMLDMLRKELDEACLTQVPTYEETQKLAVLQACIKETYRFYSPVGFGLTRISPAEGVTICGRYFQPDTILSVNIWAIHRITSIFGDDASRFNPRRWLDPVRASKMNPFMIAFGAGYNQCPGRNLAHLEISKATSMVMRDYEIELVDPNKEWKYENYFSVAPYDWPCTVRRRG